MPPPTPPPGPTPNSINAYHLVGRGFKRIPTFLAFVLAPYFYFIGASAQSAKFDVLGIKDIGFSSSAGELIYDGFNIFIESKLWAFVYIPAIAAGLFALIGWAALAIIKSAESWADETRKKLTDAKTWLRLQFDDVGIVYSPIVAVVFGYLTLSVMLGWVGLMSIGQATGQRNANARLAEIKQCVAKKGYAPGCTIITLVGSTGQMTRFPASIVFMDKDRAALSDGVSVRLVESKQIVSVRSISARH